VPIQCAPEGGISRLPRFWALGAYGAISGAKIAAMMSATMMTIPTAASGLRRSAPVSAYARPRFACIREAGAVSVSQSTARLIVTGSARRARRRGGPTAG
jgi:hypothetical protein